MERARCLVAAGPAHSDEAIATLEQGIAQLGETPSLALAVVDLEEARGDPAAALARLDRLTLNLPGAGAWLDRRAELLAKLGDRDGARWVAAAASAARERAPDSAEGGPSPEASPLASGSATVPVLQGAAPARIALALTRGPYLLEEGPNRITIRWRTDVATNSRVRYGTNLASLNSIADDPLLTTEHEITLSALAANTRYYYTVGTTTVPLAGGDAQTSFVTAPATGTPKATRIWVIGDSGTGDANAAAVRDAFSAYSASKPADLWLMLGDNAYSSGTDAEYQTGVFGMYPAMLRSTALWPTRGNHDVLYAGANNDYYDIFSLPAAGEIGGLPSGTEAYYSFDYGNIHLVCLDSEGSDRGVGGPMAVWLRADLAATPRDWVIAFWHHPPYTKGSHDSDDDLDSGGRMKDMRQIFLPILDSAGVDLVLAGHSHSYERSFLVNGHYGYSPSLTSAMILDGGDGRWNGDGAYTKPSLGTGPREGCVYTVAGVGGQTSGGLLNHPVMVTSLSVLGSMVIDVAGNRLDARFLDTQRTVRDSFTVMKGVPVGVRDETPGAGPGLRVLGAQPSRGAVRFAYRLATEARTRVVILDALGRRVRTVRSGEEPAGDREAAWDGVDERGHVTAPGVYFAVLEAGGHTWARKLVGLAP